MAFALTMGEEITRRLDTIIADVCPGVGRRSMYGGIVFEREQGDHTTLVCGHFIYKNHVSLEFSEGYQLRDPEHVLEGKGKYRRHIKLRREAEIEEKSVRAMIEQVFA